MQTAYFDSLKSLFVYHWAVRGYFSDSLLAAVVWFFALMLIAVAASLGPARNAVRLTIREVLAYE